MTDETPELASELRRWRNTADEPVPVVLGTVRWRSSVSMVDELVDWCVHPSGWVDLKVLKNNGDKWRIEPRIMPPTAITMIEVLQP